MIDYSNKNVCLDGCAPSQILNINGYAFNDISNLKIYDHCGKEYDLSKLEYAYSLDNLKIALNRMAHFIDRLRQEQKK